MVKCYECDKVYRNGKSWKFARGFYTLYATCPNCVKGNEISQGLPNFIDLRLGNPQ